MKRLHPGLMLAGVGMSIAISLLMLFCAGVTSLIPISALCLFIASLQTWIPIREEHGLLFAVLTYLISGGAALLIARSSVWTYLYIGLFGYYGIARWLLRRRLEDRFLTVLIRLLIMTAVTLLGLVFARLVLGLDPYALLPDVPPYLIAAALIAAFAVYMLLYRLFALFFDSYLRSRLLPRR